MLTHKAIRQSIHLSQRSTRTLIVFFVIGDAYQATTSQASKWAAAATATTITMQLNWAISILRHEMSRYDNKKAVLSQGEPRGAVVNFDTYVIFAARCYSRGYATICQLSVRLSVCLSVTFRYRDHIGCGLPNSLGYFSHVKHLTIDTDIDNDNGILRK